MPIVTETVVTTDPSDTYAATDEQYNKGGAHQVADNTARDAISIERRTFGMLVATQDTNPSVLYQLADIAMGGTDNDLSNNANWILFATAGGSGGTSPYTIENTSSIFSTGLSGTGSGSIATDSFFSGTDAGNGATNANNSAFIGVSAGNLATDAAESNFLGLAAGSTSAFAYYSNFMGTNSGFGATYATRSNFFGQDAGNGAATNSTYDGNNSGVYFDSNFLGKNAGYGATDANNSNFLGFGAGAGATNATNANFLGQNAGQNAISANESNFFGWAAGNGATNAAYCNFFGTSAGENSTDIQHCNFIGYQAGLNAPNNYGTNSIGVNAGTTATNATYCNFIGLNAGQDATNATYMNSIGYLAGRGATNAGYSNFIGLACGFNDTLDWVASNGIGSNLFGNFLNTGGFINSVLLGNGLNGSSISLTKDNQFMLADTIIDVRWRGIEYTLPFAQASAGGDYLSNDGSGGLSWQTTPTAAVEIVHIDSLASTPLGAGVSTGTSAEAIYLGVNAGNGATISGQSTFIGYGAGQNASNATQSNFIGKNAGSGATNAGASIFIGTEAGLTAVNADSSVFIGTGAGASATNAELAVFIGETAGNNAPNASSSVFIGRAAGANDTVNNVGSANNDSILIGNYTNTGGFSNSILLGSGDIGVGVTNSAANEFMVAPNYTRYNFRGIPYVMPAAQASNGQVLAATSVTAGVATLGWTTVSSGGGTVISVAGTSNRITSTGGTTPVIDIAATYVGQSSITTLGTVGTGTWQGTAIGSTYGGTGQNSSASTGIAAVSGGTWSFSTALPNGTTATTQAASDNSTKVATTAYIDGGFIPIAGRTYTTTTGNGCALTTSTLTSGTLLSLASTGTAAASSTQTVLNIATSGANATPGQLTWGLDIANTHTGTGTNIGMRINAASGSNNYAMITTGGLVGINTSTPTAMLDVADTALAGSGSLAGSVVNIAQTWNTSASPSAIKLNVTNTASGSTSKLLDLQLGGNNLLSVTKTAQIQFGSQSVGAQVIGSCNSTTGSGSATGESLLFLARTTNTVNAYSYWYIPASAVNPTSGTGGLFNVSGTFSPTSGTAVFNTHLIAPTINQTGGANGITRGIYINPALTSAADFRAIEVANGKTVLGGALSVTGTTTLATALTGPLRADSGVVSVDATLVATSYTPTATNVTNVTSSTPNLATYQRVGSIVSVFGSITVTNTLAVTSEVDVSLPVASNLGAATDLSGTATMDSTASVNIYVKGDATNDRAAIFFTSAGVGQTSTIYYNYQYRII